MTDFKKLHKIAWASEQGAAGLAAAAPIFLPDQKNRYIKKTKMKKKDVKFVFSCNRFLSDSQVSSLLTAIIARRG